MDAQVQKQGHILAVVLATIAILLGVGLELWSLARGDGLHGGGLIPIAVGIMVISGVRRRNPAPEEQPPA
jgi:hypothetical protein